MGLAGVFCAQTTTTQESYLSWNADRAEKEAKAMRVEGRVAGQGGIRIRSTDRSSSYKIRATWLTPDVIRGTARLLQIRERLATSDATALVSEAEAAGHTVIRVEIDPVEGSGVIPLDWGAFIQPKGVKEGEPGSVVGTNTPKLKGLKALSGIQQRDYAYDVFWVTFPLVDSGRRVLPETAREMELVVSIHGKEGKVSWPIPESIRQRTQALMQGSDGKKQLATSTGESQ
jgi:hypothetical protein